MYAIKSTAPIRADLYRMGLKVLCALTQAQLEILYNDGCEYVEKIESPNGDNPGLEATEIQNPKK